jgi:hypothetical protein
MKSWRRFSQAAKTAFLVLVTSLVLGGFALAQAPAPVPGVPGPGMPGRRGMNLGPNAQRKDSGEYVTSYALVLAGVGLGLLLVCRTSNRRDRARPEQYEESKVTATE